MKRIEKQYKEAKEYYGLLGVDTDMVLESLRHIPISIHCWQGDDVTGFDNLGSSFGGGILVTGNFKGKARNISELWQDIKKAFSLIPGDKKINLHSIYGDFKGKKIDRNQIAPEHFKSWVEWAKNNKSGIDFNPTPFSHRLAESGYTLSSKDKNIRGFWVEHIKRCREISNYFGMNLKKPCIFNIWIPDGSKDLTISKFKHREILKDSLDEIFSVIYPEKNILDSLESKLFGLGSECYVVGSHEFYLSYAIKYDKLITFDTGHFHPTELVSDKISSVLPYIKRIILHLSRGIRWDSDHVIVLSEEVIDIMKEIVRANAIQRVNISTDFFDASINRIGAWVIGARAAIKSLLIAMLEPIELIKKFEDEAILFARLGILEDTKTMPYGTIWNYYCEIMDVPGDKSWIDPVLRYEAEVLDRRK
jgi:L-rhamnose isomerase